jgi:signal transduction histidine kinase
LEFSNLVILRQRKYSKLINAFKQNIKLLIRGKYTLDNLEIDLDELQSMESDLNLNSNLTESKKNYIQVKKDKVKVLTA